MFGALTTLYFTLPQKTLELFEKFEGLSKVTPTGTEQTAFSSGKTGGADQSSAKSSALPGDSAPLYPELALIVDQWPDLPEATRQQIVAMLQAQQAHSPKNRAV